MNCDHTHSCFDEDRMQVIKSSMEKMFGLDLGHEIEEIKEEIKQYKDFLDRNLENLLSEEPSVDLREDSESDFTSE